VIVVAAAGFALLAYVYLTLPDVRSLARRNPAETAFMRIRAEQAAREGKSVRHLQRWISYARISPNLKRAVLVAEDDAFWDHEGVDFDQIRQSIEVNLERGRAVRGASTITQQLAKNLYLSPARDPMRKLRELIIARRLETALPKARILEIYLNVIEWGDGIWGADAAARTYFGVSAAALTADQSALLAAAIVNPRLLNPAHPSARLLSRQRMIRGRMGGVTPPAPVPVPVAEPPSIEQPPLPAEETAPIPVGTPSPTSEDPVSPPLQQ